MAKISELTPIDAFQGNETLPVIRNGSTWRATMSALAQGITPLLQNWYKGDQGDRGPQGYVAATRTQLAAAPRTEVSLSWDGALFSFAVGDFSTAATTHPNDFVIATTSGPAGAWIRQRADRLATRRAGIGSTTEPLQTFLDRVGIWPEQFGSRVGGFDDARLQKALNALSTGDSLYIADQFILSTGSLQLINRSGVRIYGPGQIVLDGGAADDSRMLKMVGTCDNIMVQGIRFSGPGRSDATARHYGILNNSGQFLSKIWIDGCTFEDLNVGCGFGTESAGSASNGFITRNVCKRMTGTLGGQGYGIFVAGASDVVVAHNQIEFSERHAIYVSRLADNAGQFESVFVHGNLIRNHRQTIQGGVNRHAIFMGRGFGGKISNNTIVDYWDGAIGVGQDSGGGGAPIRQCGDIEIVDNTLIGRRNALSSIQIAEPLVPTTATIQRIDVKRNKIYSDLSAGGPQFEVEIFNGKTISVTDNDFYLANVPNGAGFRLIGVGTIAGPGDTADIYIERNKIRGTATTPSTINFNLARLFADVCTGTAKVVVRDNDNDTGFNSQNVEYNVTPTNPNIIDLVPGQQLIGRYAPGDTTPTVGNGVQQLLLTNASATDITNFDNGVTGQVLMIKFADGNTTLKLNTNLRLAADIVGSIYRTVQLVKSAGGSWHPVSDISGS